MFKKSLPIILSQLNRTLNKTQTREFSSLSCRILTCRESKITPTHYSGCIGLVRSYAKSKDVRKDKKKKITIDENELGEVIDVEKLYKEFEHRVNSFKEELVKYAVVRTAQGAIETFKIEFEGEHYTLQDLAEISKKSQNMYVLDFCNFPQVSSVALKALQNSEMNLNAQQDGTRLYVPIPKVTKEHREILAKKAKSIFIKYRDSIKDLSIRYIKDLSKIKDLSQELKISVSDQITAIGNKNVEEIEKLYKEKEKDLLKVE